MVAYLPHKQVVVGSNPTPCSKGYKRRGKLWIRRAIAVVMIVGTVVVLACSQPAPIPTLQPRPVATARESATYVTPTPVQQVTPMVIAVPSVVPIVGAASLFEHPWPVGTTITSYPDLDELTKPLVDEIIAVLPEYESYVVVARYIPEVFLVPYGRMDEMLVEARTGQYAGEYELVTWYAPGQTPVVLWGEGAAAQ